jgi:hypothetical protein
VVTCQKIVLNLFFYSFLPSPGRLHSGRLRIYLTNSFLSFIFLIFQHLVSTFAYSIPSRSYYMARKKNVTSLSAEELYELARQREREEQEAQREAQREQIEELRERRRELIAQHRKDLAAVDKEIRQFGGRTRGGRAQGGGRGGKISDRVVDTIASVGKISTRDLKASLDENGIETKNLNQMLAYLKRSGRVVSTGRGMYAVAK